MDDSPYLIDNLSAFAFVNDNIDITSAKIKVNLFIIKYFCVYVISFDAFLHIAKIALFYPNA